MENVYTLTFCEWNSYGSILQSLGLQKYLETIGYESTIIQYKPVLPPENRKRFKQLLRLNKVVHELFELMIMNKLKCRHRKTENFICKNIRIKYFSGYESLCENPPKATAFLVGSDQVWNPIKCEPAFFLDFVPEGVRKISYAASMGTTKIPENKKQLFQKYISRFDSVSLREHDSIPYVEPWATCPVCRHIDPVFLLNAEEWRKYEEPYRDLSMPYILVYALYWDPALNRQLRLLHRKTGMDIVAVAGGLQAVYANRRIYDADIAQFLWLIDHAEMVVTSSFHGVALSTVFEKRCAAIINPASPSRIQCLMELLGLKNISIAELADCEATDWNAVRRKIVQERRNSTDYLKGALQTP